MGAPFRQKLELFLIALFILFAFASYSKYTASTAWLQWTTLVIFLVFTYTFDKSFTDESSFVFDPDAVSYRAMLVCSVATWIPQYDTCSPPFLSILSFPSMRRTTGDERPRRARCNSLAIYLALGGRDRSDGMERM